MLYSELIPNNLGIIFRKEYTDLRDSTVKDFEKYTNLKVDSQRSVVLSNKSTILFRHIEELHNIQNVNLGWFAIEQGDELETDNEFFLLFGRLRRAVEPSKAFIDYGLAERTGFVIGNAGDHWGKNLWKEGNLEDAQMIEATTWDNQDCLPKDFLDSLKVLERTKPEIYKKFVMNDWSVSGTQFLLITKESIKLLEGVQHNIINDKRLLSCDPSMGGDECVIYIFENSKVIEEKILHLNDTMKIVGEIIILMNKHSIKDCAIDSIGIGKGIVDRLSEMGKNVIAINSAEKANDSEKFYNRRAEMWWHTMEQIQAREVEHFKDNELIRQLTSVRYKVVNSNGKLQLEPKDETKKRLGNSPDRADAFVYGIWALQQIKESGLNHNFNIRKRPIFSGAGGY